MSAITETEAPSAVSYTLAPTDINYSADRCRGRLFRDEDYDSRWSPPVGRESQCTGRVAEDSLCSRCLHNLARWRESCGTADVRGGDQDWWGRVDDPMPARAPTLAGTGWVAEKKPGWKADTVESLAATLAALTAEYAQFDFDYGCLAEEEDDWPRESDDVDEQLRAEHVELRHLSKVIKEGGVLPPAAAAPAAAAPAPAAETLESLRVKIAEMRKTRDNLKRCLDEMLAEGWVISKRVRKAFADVREKIALAREVLALRAENAALKAAAVPADMVAENAALRARIAALEEELADADSLNKSLRVQLADADSLNKSLTAQLSDADSLNKSLKAQLDEADFHRRAFESENERLIREINDLADQLESAGDAATNWEETNGRLRAELEEAFAAKRQFSEDLELITASNNNLERRCEELEETIHGLRRNLEDRAVADHEADVGREEAADLERALAYEKDRWLERYKELRRLIVEVLAEVEPVLARERTIPAGVVLRALSVLK